MTTPITAPARRDLTVYCGEDFTMQVNYTDANNNAIPVNSPRMDIRVSQYDTASPIIAPVTCTASGNTVTASIPKAASLAVQVAYGFYDLFAIRTDNGNEVQLANGRVVFAPNVTTLP